MTGNDFENTANAVASQSFAARLGRGEAKVPLSSEEKEDALSTYKAFGHLQADGVTETCDIRSWLENSEMAYGIEVSYRILLQIGYVGEEQIKLFFPDCIVVIDGMYLRDLRKKLARRQVTYIQQYSARVWPQAPVKGETFIEKITITRPSEAAAPRGQNSL